MARTKILLVDDEANVLKSLKRLFIDSDYKIFTAASGDEGLAVCAKEQIALVMSDYRMPGMSGVQFLAKVKEDYPSTIRIILSGYADVAAIVESINDGQVYKFLSKPWNDQDLLTTIQRSLEHYNLQNENAALLSKLRVANTELKQLTDGLEVQVEERTRDLDQKNRALEVAQRLLHLLPAGVIGVDDQGTLVYMNDAMRDYVDASQLVLGQPLAGHLESGLLASLKEAMATQQTTCTIDESRGGIQVICRPLPNQAGVVGLFSFAELSRHIKETSPSGANSETSHAS